MKNNYIKCLLALLLIVFSNLSCLAQKKKHHSVQQTGYFYQSNGITVPLTYTVKYLTIDSDYVSKYKIFIDGEYSYDIIATHTKATNHVKVEVDQSGGGLLAMVGPPEEITYSTPSLLPFGTSGGGKVLFGQPNELTLKFKDTSFTYVKVMSVIGFIRDDGADFYVLRQ